MSEVLLTTATPVAAVPPMVTVGPTPNPVPVTVTAVPPVTGPEPGVTLVTVTVAVGGVVLWQATSTKEPTMRRTGSQRERFDCISSYLGSCMQ